MRAAGGGLVLVAVTCDRRLGRGHDGPRVRPGRAEVWVSELTLDHLRAAGLTPILLPPGGTDMETVLGAVAGVVITGGAFDIDAQGRIIVINSSALNYETTPSFTVITTVKDTGIPSTSMGATITISLVDINDAPVIGKYLSVEFVCFV